MLAYILSFMERTEGTKFKPNGIYSANKILIVLEISRQYDPQFEELGD